jgi:hypothetical protein
MQALTFGGKEIIEYSSVKDPQLLHSTDAIVRNNDGRHLWF